MLKILPYKRASASARLLARAMPCKRIVSPGYRQRRRETVINWGSSSPTQALDYGRVLNKPQAVRIASNKLLALKCMKAAGVSTPEFTESSQEAAGWLRGDSRVVARKVLNGHSGQGAVVVEAGQQLPPAPLYTKYVRRDAEFRVHIFQGKVIDYVRKKRRNGYENDPNFNPHIRTHNHGWVFARDGVDLPACVLAESLGAVRALGLDFGAVDVIFREGRAGPRAYVLEVNTAPGVEGTTLTRYVQAFREALSTRRVNNY